ncbi:MAG: bifunctional glutamate N-acetyltransferase/amino-acid acetyltransferase ArgJ [Eubacterium sp.]|jgi:glutamate N-acetyltransferase/amino-acid N-acetyltransferase|nr:bifunctional glutamate N-acetyltransferase/amino-acid acetyltransferase ArgJ [Eubacterium sp.]
MIEFENYNFVYGGVCAAKGFVAGGAAAGIKPGSKKNDLAVIYSLKPCAAAAVYTANKVKGAPITVTKKNLKNGMAQAVVVNSGNANTCNHDGLEIAEKICELTANELHVAKDDIILASTGVIGQKLSIIPFETHLPALCASLTEFGSEAAALSIMTTDTTKKEVAVKFEISGKTCHIGGIAKGSGMICPNMATLLCFITTDVLIDKKMLQIALNEAARVTFNRVSVDGDTSTNDMVSIMASGAAGNPEIITDDESYEIFFSGLYAVMVNLAREIARDGEGATKLIECLAVNAPDEQVAETIAKAVIRSNLFKAALFAADANWGRILCAIGYADANFDISRVSVDLISRAGMIRVCENGSGVEFSEEYAHTILLEDEITVYINLNSGGDGEAVTWGCDLTYDYVKINAEYRS